MSSDVDYLARLSAITEEMDRLNKHEKLTAAEQVRMAQLSTEFGRVEMERLQAASRAGWKEAGVPGMPDGRPAERFVDGAPLTRDQHFNDFVRARNLVKDGQENLSFGAYLRGLATGHWRGAAAEQRAMAEGTLSAGGYLVPTLLSGQIVDLARNEAQVLRAGARVVPMPNRVVDIAKWLSDPTAQWHTEAATISPSDATLGKVTLTAQALASLVIVSRELLEDARDVDDELRRAFVQQFALTVDKVALYGSGTAPEPRGVRNTTGITVQSMGANGAALTNHDPFVDAVGTLQDNNETPNGILPAPRTARALGKLQDTSNQPLQAPPMLDGIARHVTAQVPTNLTQGTSTAASDVFVADWSQLYLGVRTDLQVSGCRRRSARRSARPATRAGRAS